LIGGENEEKQMKSEKLSLLILWWALIALMLVGIALITTFVKAFKSGGNSLDTDNARRIKGEVVRVQNSSYPGYGMTNFYVATNVAISTDMYQVVVMATNQNGAIQMFTMFNDKALPIGKKVEPSYVQFEGVGMGAGHDAIFIVE
jgi:hypothetical protein